MAKKKKAKNELNALRLNKVAESYARGAAFFLHEDSENESELPRSIVLGWAALLLGEEASAHEGWAAYGEKLSQADLKKLTFPADIAKNDWKGELVQMCQSPSAEKLPAARMIRHFEFLQAAVRDLQPEGSKERGSPLRDARVLSGIFLFVFVLVGFVRAMYAPSRSDPSSTPQPVRNEILNEPNKHERPIYYLDELSPVTEEGSYWSAPENKAFDSEGVELHFREPLKLDRLSISLDGNDSYIVRFFDRTQLIAGVVVGMGTGIGMRARLLKVPFPDLISHFDIIPITGDNRYSLGHVELLPAAP